MGPQNSQLYHSTTARHEKYKQTQHVLRKVISDEKFCHAGGRNSGMQQHASTMWLSYPHCVSMGSVNRIRCMNSSGTPGISLHRISMLSRAMRFPHSFGRLLLHPVPQGSRYTQKHGAIQGHSLRERWRSDGQINAECRGQGLALVFEENIPFGLSRLQDT